VDELPELDEIYATNPKNRSTAAADTPTPQSRPAGSPAGSVAVNSIASEDFGGQSAWTPRSLYSGTQITSPSKRRRTNDSDRSSFHQLPSIIPFHGGSSSFTASPARQEDAIDSLLRAANFSEQEVQQGNILGSPSDAQVQPYGKIQPETPGVWPHANLQEACLMRYFIDELACWVSHVFRLGLNYLTYLSV
jgi:hypothetical protein